MDLPKHVFFEGKIVPFEEAKVSVATHAFNYGTAVFGGIRGYWNDDKKKLYIFRPLRSLPPLIEFGAHDEYAYSLR